MARAAMCVGAFLLTILNPTSVLTHLAEVKTLPGDAVMLSEPSLTKGGQKFASAELGQGLPIEMCIQYWTVFAIPRDTMR